MKCEPFIPESYQVIADIEAEVLPSFTSCTVEALQNSINSIHPISFNRASFNLH